MLVLFVGVVKPDGWVTDKVVEPDVRGVNSRVASLVPPMMVAEGPGRVPTALLLLATGAVTERPARSACAETNPLDALRMAVETVTLPLVG